MIQIIDIDLLIPFENHPFKKRNGIEQQELTEEEAIVQMVDSNIHREHILPSEKKPLHTK